MRNYQAVIIMHFKYNLTHSLLHLGYKNKTMSTNVNSQSAMDANILTRPNFLDWLKNLKIVFKKERLTYVITEPLPECTTANAPKSVQRAYHKCLVDSVRARLIIHLSMSPEFQKQYKIVDA